MTQCATSCDVFGKLGLRKDGVEGLATALDFFHKYSHPIRLTIAAITSFSVEGLCVGASYDDGKVGEYEKEVSGRVTLGSVFSNFIAAVKTNVDEMEAIVL